MNIHRMPITRIRLGGDRGVFAGLLVLLIWLPWPRGGHTSLSEAQLGVTTAFLTAVWAIQFLLNQITWPTLSRSAIIGLCLWALWLLWIGLSLVSLPVGWLTALSPSVAEIHAALQEVPSAEIHNTLSITPAETFTQLLLSLSYFGLYLLTIFTVNSRKRQRLVLLTLVSVGLAQALYGIQRMYSGFEIAGFEVPASTTDRASGSFINPNHFSAYLELVLSAGLGLILADLRGWNGRNWRHLAAEAIELSFSTKFRVRVFMIAVVVAMVLSRSRMGNIAFITALSVCGTTYLLLRRSRWLIPALFLFVSVALVDIWIVSDRFGLERLVNRIQKTELSQEERPLVLADLAPVFEQYALIGAGTGGFEAAYSPHRNEIIRKRYDHAHNEYAEFLIETGAVGLGILAFLVGLHLIHAIRVFAKRRDPIRSGVAFAGFMAITTLLIHASAEFLLHIPAIAATLIVLMGLVINISTRGRSQLRPESQILFGQDELHSDTVS